MRRTLAALLCVFLLFAAFPGLAEFWFLSDESTGQPDAQSGSVLYVVDCESYVTLRALPSTDAEALARVSLGEPVTCYGDVENGFSEVEYEGRHGYILTQYLSWMESAPTGACTAMYVVNCREYVPLRTQPNASACVLARVPLGASVDVYEGGDQEFSHVGYEGKFGYVLKEYLSASPEAFGAFLSEDPGYERLDTSDIEAFASSEQVDQYGYYSAANANDADSSTTWAEGANGLGEGEWLSFFFEERMIAGFAIRAGYQKSSTTYNSNARPASILISVAGEDDCSVTLADRQMEQIVLFQHPVITDYLSIEIASAYSGTGYADTCISDVRILLAP